MVRISTSAYTQEQKIGRMTKGSTTSPGFLTLFSQELKRLFSGNIITTGGGSRIRTCEALRRQIYSLLRLAAPASLHPRKPKPERGFEPANLPITSRLRYPCATRALEFEIPKKYSKGGWGCQTKGHFFEAPYPLSPLPPSKEGCGGGEMKRGCTPPGRPAFADVLGRWARSLRVLIPSGRGSLSHHCHCESQ